jgi:hypothetical protein
MTMPAPEWNREFLAVFINFPLAVTYHSADPLCARIRRRSCGTQKRQLPVIDRPPAKKGFFVCPAAYLAVPDGGWPAADQRAVKRNTSWFDFAGVNLPAGPINGACSVE